MVDKGSMTGFVVQDVVCACGTGLSSVHLSTDLMGKRFKVPRVPNMLDGAFHVYGPHLNFRKSDLLILGRRVGDWSTYLL